MSLNWPLDVAAMHEKYGMFDHAMQLPVEQLKPHLDFRISMLKEEVRELEESSTPEDQVDAIIDLIVFAIGTLDLFGADYYAAWDQVMDANMNKVPGVKESRPNPFGFPDLLKPEGWKPPDYTNVGTGRFAEIR